MATKRSFTREQLEEMTVPELRELCVYDLEIPGMTKKPKHNIIDTIFGKYGAASSVAPAAPAAKASVVPKAAAGPVAGLDFTGHSVMTKPSAPAGQRTTTTIQVSCGATSGAFPVVGRTVREVGDFLREILNVDQLSTGLVNSKEVGADYVLKAGDNLEFLKPAGKKGF